VHTARRGKDIGYMGGGAMRVASGSDGSLYSSSIVHCRSLSEGGGIVTDRSTLKLHNTEVRNCHVDLYRLITPLDGAAHQGQDTPETNRDGGGGCMAAAAYAVVQISGNSSFVQCNAPLGGGFRLKEGVTLTIEDGRVTDCSSLLDSSYNNDGEVGGGALFLDQSTATLERTGIHRCTSNLRAGRWRS
jgi:hypothetical protein